MVTGMERTVETHDVDAIDIGGEQVSSQPTQITSIDGFFNRKRGRPPKNRFVEVYKSAQQSPQAIFTSFKLEKNEQNQNNSNLITSLDNGDDHLITANGLNPTDLTPSRSRKRARPYAVETDRITTVKPSQVPLKTTATKEFEETSQQIFSTPCIPIPLASNKSLERVSVVRAAGTFYPENANTIQTQEPAGSTAPPLAFINSPSCSTMEQCSLEEPEDLSMRACIATKSNGLNTEPETSLKLLHFKQLIDLYQRQVLLPSFLAAASQPAGLDMRLLLENAAQQKMLLMNAAAAGAVAAAAAAAAATATTTTITTSTVVTTDGTPPTTTRTPSTSRTLSQSVTRGSGSKRARDQDIPKGYLKFRFNEDCHFERCGYRNHQSHFHCNRRDCHYSFCDKTRFVQHTARHERMDTLMGDDFRQYRANMHCDVPDCCYATSTQLTNVASTAINCNRTEDNVAPKKSSHFHCRKCDYVCTDSNKVVAHRRLHMRLEYVRSAGFRKVASGESCESASCSYALRHTHYHCTTCDCSVLSRAQLASHRHRSNQQPIKLMNVDADEDLETCL